MCANLLCELDAEVAILRKLLELDEESTSNLESNKG